MLWELSGDRVRKASGPPPKLHAHEEWLLDLFRQLDTGRQWQDLVVGRAVVSIPRGIPVRDAFALAADLEMPAHMRPAFVSIMREVDNEYMRHERNMVNARVVSSNGSPDGDAGGGQRR